MYHRKAWEQITMYDFNQGFGFPISEDNRWVQLSKKIPWDEAEDLYAGKFTKGNGPGTGNVALPFRTALGALIIRRVLGLSDRGTVKAIQETPCLQYFLGFPRYEDRPPFDPSMMVHFRERLDLDAMGAITDLVIAFEKKTAAARKRAGTGEGLPRVPDAKALETSMAEAAATMAAGVMLGGKCRQEAYVLGGGKKAGTLIVDATCCPVNIRYPQDISLLNEAREKLEAMLDRLCKERGQKKPRTYCRVVRKEYLSLAKARKKGKKQVRRMVRILLNCVERNTRHIQSLLGDGSALTAKETAQMGTIQELYRQQKHMYDRKVHRVDQRIVSLHMPFIRPIVRGKVPEPVEFGPKMDLSVDAWGNSRVEFYSYEAYNESTHLVDAIEAYRRRTGVYPERVLADTIYRNRENRKYCQCRGIRMSGPRLGRPPADQGKAKAAKRAEREDMVDRIEVERRFSREKRCFGLDKVWEKKDDTVGSSVALGVLLDNLVPAGF